MPERTIIGDDLAEGREPAASNSMDAIIEAYNEALGSVMKRLVTWTLRRIGGGNRARRKMGPGRDGGHAHPPPPFLRDRGHPPPLAAPPSSTSPHPLPLH